MVIMVVLVVVHYKRAVSGFCTPHFWIHLSWQLNNTLPILKANQFGGFC